MRAKILITLLLLLSFVPAQIGFADDGQLVAAIQDLQKQMEKMQSTIERQDAKIRQLETRPAQITTVPSGTGEVTTTPPMSDYEFNERLAGALGGANKWLKDLSAKGDIRLRYEAFQQTSGAPTNTDDRNRFRYRLRYGLEKKFNDDVKAGFSLASGEAPTLDPTSTTSPSEAVNRDPRSTNTTLDNDFNFKPIYIEKVYASYTPPILKNKGVLKQTELRAGKMDNAFEKGSSDMIWDRDVKPEGVIEKFDLNLYDGSEVDLGGYFTAGQFILDEDSNNSSFAGDAELYAFQIGLNPVIYVDALERPVDLLSAMSYYSYNDYATNSNFIIGAQTLAGGNSNIVGPAGDLDVEDFEIFEVYHELAFYPYGLPVRPFFDWARNMNASNPEGAIGLGEKDAWALGVKFGGIVKKGDWELSYAYKRIAANVMPSFNDSDFGTTGHSGKRGSVFKGAYGITDNISLNFAAIFVNNLNVGTSTLIDEEQRRFQLDLVWKF